MLKKDCTYQILLHGLVYFCRKFPSFLATRGWEFRHFDPHHVSAHIPAALYLQRCDLAYCWGGRLSLGKFLAMARLLRKKNVVQFWCGSDTLNGRKEYDAGRVDPWVAETIHWAGSPWLAEEVQAMGVQCEYVPSTWVEIPESIPPMPKEFSVLAHLPSASKLELYGIDHLFEAARKLPQVRFHVVGILPGERLQAPANVAVHGRVPSMYPFFRNASVFWRPARHDGLAFVSLEALAHGRHVLWTYPFPGATVAPDATTGYQEIQRLYELHCNGKLQVNRLAAQYIAANFNPRTIREGILTRWMKIIQSPSGGYAPGYCDQQAVP